MNSSTPNRSKARPRSEEEQFDEITPIKSSTHIDPEFRNFHLDNSFDDFLANDLSIFGDGKRKYELLNETNSKLKQSLDFNRSKKQRVTDMKSYIQSIKNRNSINGQQSVKSLTPGADMFDDVMWKEQSKNGEIRKTSQDNVKSGEMSDDIIESSMFPNEMPSLCNELNISVLDKLERNISPEIDPKLEPSESISEDSFGLNIEVKKNAVVNSILKTIDFENNVKDEEDKQEKKSITEFEFTQILMESVIKWESDSSNIKEIGGNLKLADKIKKKLLDNINNTNISKSSATGWSQMDSFSNMFEDSMIKNSEYQELGPFFGLPSKVQKLYEELKGIKELYSWQRECLTLKAVKERKNLVYSLPTSGGKTLVAEILILRELMCYKRNVLFILPFVSIVQEKVHDLSNFALELGFLVEEYAAGKGCIPLRKRRNRKSVIIATIEKAFAVIISLIETNQLQDFGLIVVDELHLVSEESGRGSTLESLLTLVLHLGDRLQVIGMTATIGNLNEIAEFLKAKAYAGSFRPVELAEYVKCGNDVFTVNWGAEDLLTPVRVVESPALETDPDGITELVLEIVPNDSVLVFCPTKKNCENVSLLITQVMPRHIQNHKAAEKMSFIRALQSETNGQLCPIMKKTIPFGVVYHHSGLTPGERKLLEEGFRTGTLSVICCTSTLAAGVNLPAARVILRSPYIGKDFISLSKYKQMIGRAGRAGMGCKGESYLICQSSDSPKVDELLRSKMDESLSKMNEDSLKSLILSSVGLGVAATRRELRNLVNCTLLSVQAEKLNVDVKKMIDSCITSLFKMGAIKVMKSEHSEEAENNSKLELTLNTSENKSFKLTNACHLRVSRLGKAAMKGCIGVERAHELYGDLIKAQASLVLLTELHLLYLVTPYEMIDQIKPKYSVYFNVYMQLNAKELPAAKIVGVTEFVISKIATGVKPKNISEAVLNRLYVALILNEMIKRQNIWSVAKLFEISAGLVQTLITSTSTFANNVLRFCEELSELWSLKSLLSEFAPRLAHCCSTELLPLMELPAVKRGRAKQLYDAGFRTLNIVANADVNDMVRKVDHLPKRVAGQIIAAARLLLLEKAENLKEEAEEVLQGLVQKVVSN